MYAIIKIAGKQYRVKQDDVIDVDLLDADVGALVEFNDILFMQDGSNPMVGGPHIADFVVKGELLNVVAGPKIESVKYKRSHNQCRKFGHRQHYSRIKITEIGGAHKEKHAKHNTTQG